jgi:RHS repeat-associated protein
MSSYTLAGATRTLTYDAAGRITQTTDGTPATQVTYSYDELDRVTGYVPFATSYSYSYDAVGNRTSSTAGTSTNTLSYPSSSNRLSSVAGPSARTYTYDAMGNATSDGTHSFTYNGRGRLVSATVPGQLNVLTSVNGLGQRVLKSNNQFAYDEAGHLIAEFEWQGNLRTEWVYLGSMPVIVMTRSTQEVIVDDAATDQTITIVGTWQQANTDPGFYASAYHKKAAGSGSASFTWTPAVSGSQSYLVYARWTSNTDRATNATYTVFHASGSNSISVNQQANAAEWNLLGTYTFTAGQNHRVVLTDAANGVVVADAIKLVPSNQGDDVNYIHTDQIDTPRAIVNQSNQQLWRWAETDPFGSLPPNINPSGLGPFTFNLRFPGQYFDAETNLHYNYFRDYDPALGRYVESDPIGSVLFQGMAGEDLHATATKELDLYSLLFRARPELNHLYLYSKADPVRQTDRFGLASIPLNVPSQSSTAQSGTQVCQFMQLCYLFTQRVVGPDKICTYQCARGFKDFTVPALLACPERQAFF